ncbi:hypothetical protein ACFVYT_27750 [Streptomyces sp. NPDC058290]|uniref:hypothetical protein n=1 Tax=Streptomyces sp. NPDC058290 TaxID=3346426 RepID=UPI0036E0E391
MDGATDPRMARALRNCLAYTGVFQRRYAQSRTLFTEALHLSRRDLDPAEEARALIGLASVEVSVGEGEPAISHDSAWLGLPEPPHNDWVAAMAFVIQGLAHQLEGRNEEALAGFAEARTHADRSRRPRLLGRVLSFAADIHLRLGRYAEAMSLLRQAVLLVEEAGDVFLCARGLTRLGTAELGEGDPVAAIALHHQALRQNQLLSPFTEPGYDWLEMDIRSRLGRAYVVAGCIHEALGQFRAVLEVPGPCTPH